jgi:hypothetical protein
MVTFAQLPKHLAWAFMAGIEKGGIPVIPLRGTGQFNPDGVRDYDLLIPASAEALALERHAADRERYLGDAERWREQYSAEFGIKPPETLRPMPGRSPKKASGGTSHGSESPSPSGETPSPSGESPSP